MITMTERGEEEPIGRGREDLPASTEPGSTRALVALLAFVLGFAIVPHRVCERGAADWFDGRPDVAEPLARGVARWTETELAPGAFATGSARFDGEWLLVTYAMGAVGLGQLARIDPARREAHLARMERCLDALLDPRARAFDGAAWSEDALASAETHGHVGFLGYAALPLALHRLVRGSSRFDEAEAGVVRRFGERILASPAGLAETYPGEVYPVDNLAGLAALAVHARASGEPPSPALERGLRAIREHAIDPATGLLFQSVAREGVAARASGTALAAFFLAYADPAIGRDLFRALEASQFRTVLGFGAMLEYPAGRREAGDVDSGPVVLGFGVSASGFALGASRAYGDREAFTALYATAHLFGAPFDEDGVRTYATGGPIGDAILLAMLTAPREGP